MCEKCAELEKKLDVLRGEIDVLHQRVYEAEAAEEQAKYHESRLSEEADEVLREKLERIDAGEMDMSRLTNAGLLRLVAAVAAEQALRERAGLAPKAA